VRHKVFAYGNLMEGMPLYSTSDGVTILGTGTVHGTMYYAGYPRVLLGGTSLVHGEVHEMGDSTLRVFDHLENLRAYADDPTWYKRLTCVVTMTNGTVYENVWIYAPLQAGKGWRVIPHGSFRRYMKGEA